MLEQFAHFGATDEGFYVVEKIEKRIREQKPLNIWPAHWQLYESVPGWDRAAEMLTVEANQIVNDFMGILK